MTAAASRPIRPARGVAPAESSASAGVGTGVGGGAGADEGPRLRLAAARGTLGLELDAPFVLKPLRLTALSLTFPNIRFPIDLSGGVTRFRHKRGALARLVFDVAPMELASWVAPKLRGLLGEGTPEVWLAGVEGGVAVGVADGDAALAFDVLVVPQGGGLTVVVERARGIGLGGPPQALALRALAAALPRVGPIQGGALRLPDAAASLLRAALPAAGARAPSIEGALWDVPRPEGDRFRFELQVDVPPPALPDRLLRASETLLLTAEAEDAAYRGDTARARDHYLAALERAPRHPEISERLAWLDTVAGERAEAALSTLIDVTPAVDAGLLGAELLAAVGDLDGARGALARAARAEPFGPLAARTWLRSAALADDLRGRIEALDEAIARAPALPAARWSRLTARLLAADPRSALADAEHLEAAARGARARHEITRRAARIFLAEGFSTEAHRLFERALRYVPDDAEAVAGLARTLAAQGATRRALDLFGRALALAERAGTPTSSLAVDLAKALVEVASDRPAAIARVRTVPASAPEAAEARLLEARWRAELGDLAGAGLAIGRLRDQAERESTPPTANPHAANARGISSEASPPHAAGRSHAAAARDLGAHEASPPHAAVRSSSGSRAVESTPSTGATSRAEAMGTAAASRAGALGAGTSRLEAMPGTAAASRAEAMAALLAEAALIDERFRDDLTGAQRDLALALRLAPRDARLGAAFRRIAREVTKRAAGAPTPAATGGAPAMPPPPRRTAAAPRARPPLPPAPPDDLLADSHTFASPPRDRTQEPRATSASPAASSARSSTAATASGARTGTAASGTSTTSTRSASTASGAHAERRAPRLDLPPRRPVGSDARDASPAHDADATYAADDTGPLPAVTSAPHHTDSSYEPDDTGPHPAASHPAARGYEPNDTGPHPAASHHAATGYEPDDTGPHPAASSTLAPTSHEGSDYEPDDTGPHPALSPTLAPTAHDDSLLADAADFDADDSATHAFEPTPAAPDSRDRAADEALAEQLADRMRGNPRDRATVRALSEVLERLGRDLELFALLSARMDEGDREERLAVAPLRRAVLARLAHRARSAGNPSEAELYEMMLDAEE